MSPTPTVLIPGLLCTPRLYAEQLPDRAAEMADRIPQARLVVIPECGHLSALEQPAAVTKALVGLLSE